MRDLLSIDHITDHDLPGFKTIADQGMPDQTLAGSFIIRSDLVPLHKFQRQLQNFFVHGNSQSAVGIFNNIMCSACIETGNRVSRFICSERKLCFISIIKRLVHSDDRIHRFLRHFR